MTKKQYLKKLENCIQALPVDERNEALDYYSNYFDDADDDDKVMEELGEPEDLAKTIIEKFTCVPAKSASKNKKKAESENAESGSTENYEPDYYQEKLCYEFNKNSINNLGISVGACDVFIKKGSDFKVETRGIAEKDFRCEVNQAGTLIVENKKFPSNGKKYGHAFKNKWCPRILITAPDTELENVKLVLGAGQIRSKDLKLKAGRLMVDVGAGNLELDGITSDSANVHCSMGNAEIRGKLKGFSKIDVAMGSVKVVLSDKQNDYSCDVKIGLGTVKFGDEKHSGFSQSFNNEKRKNHFSINVGMGDAKIKFND